MKVEWFRSATVGVTSNSGTSILCDPWLTDGAFLGSWYHFPPLKGFEFQEVLGRPWDAVYVSHLHADHFDRKFLSALSRRQPDCVVIIPSFAHDWLRRAVENCGFTPRRIIQVDSGTTLTIGDVLITVLTADHCDPEICGISIPCHQGDLRLAAIDSLAVFEADGFRVLNANDSLAVASVSQALSSIGEVDLLLGHYGGAGPFPQCFVDLSDEEKLTRGKTLAHGFLARLSAATRVTRAKAVMPFAGQYVLGGRLAALNKWRSVVSLSEAVDWVHENTEARVIAMSPFSGFHLDTGIVDEPWKEPTEREISAYVERISKNSYPYEKVKKEWMNAEYELEQALGNVASEYTRRAGLGLLYPKHRLSIETSLVSGFIDVDGLKTSVYVGVLPEMLDQETRLSCHPNLLKGLIQRAEGYEGFTPMHFNQAEIGSHFEWRRNGEFNELVRCLNFLQTNGTLSIPLLRA